MSVNRALHLLPAVLALACASGADVVPRRTTQTTSQVRMVRIGPGVSLEVVDWGGRGPALVFLAGLGGTAHTFDGFAPQFADSFHVLGITRRGFGASSSAPPPSELDTLVADVTTVLDSLGIDAAVLVGHSIAGEEMTRFAELHDERCRGLVYLDAAYDRSGVDTLAKKQPNAPPPRFDAADTASFTSIRAFHRRVMGVREPDSEIRASARFDADDRYRGEVTPDSLKALVASGKRVARYDKVRCPGLGIFALADSIADVIPYHAELDAAGRRQAETFRQFVQLVVADGRKRFGRYPQNTVVDVHHSNHFVFLNHPDEVARAMRPFIHDLERPAPPAPRPGRARFLTSAPSALRSE